MLESDVEVEGGLWASKEEFINLFGSSNTLVWGARFQLLS